MAGESWLPMTIQDQASDKKETNLFNLNAKFRFAYF